MIHTWFNLTETKLAFNLISVKAQVENTGSDHLDILRSISSSPYCVGLIYMGVNDVTDRDVWMAFTYAQRSVTDVDFQLIVLKQEDNDFLLAILEHKPIR